MHRVDNDRAVAIMPTPEAAGTPGYFTLGDPIEGILPSTLPADWCNTLQEEIAGVIEEVGLSLDKTDNTQLKQAITALDNIRGWDVTGSAFAGEDLDTKLDNALSTVDDGTRLIWPATDTPFVYEGDHVLDLNADTGRWLILQGAMTPIRYDGTGTFLRIEADFPTIANPRTLIQGLIIEPVANHHWSGCGIQISNTGGVQIDRLFIARFGTGIQLLNELVDAQEGYVENTLISHCIIRGNRIGIHGLCDGGTNSQRATQLLNCLLGCTHNPTGYVSDATGDEADIWHYGIVLESVNWYHTRISASINLKRSKSCAIKLIGGSLNTSLIHIEAEGSTSLDHIVGLWLQNDDDGGIPSANSATGLITITAIPDPDAEPAESGTDDNPVSQLICDQRDDVTQIYSFGNLLIKGGWNATPGPANGIGHQILPTHEVIEDSTTRKMYVAGVADTEGAVLKEEYWNHPPAGYGQWIQKYAAAELALTTTAHASDRPIAVECFPINERYSTFEAVTADGDINYVDITDLNLNLIRLSVNDTLHQIRGGRIGQVINLALLDQTIVLKHFTKQNEHGDLTLDAAVLEDATTAVITGLTAKIQPGFIINVEGDTTDYTVLTCGALSNGVATITFTPGAAQNWSQGDDVTELCQNIFKLNAAADYTTSHDWEGLRFVYVYHSPLGWFWQQV